MTGGALAEAHRYRGQSISLNRCWLCDNLRKCEFVIKIRGQWRPVCRECAENFKGGPL